MKENVFSKILIVVYILLSILMPFAFIKFCLNDQSRYLWFWLLLIIYLFVSIIFNISYSYKNIAFVGFYLKMKDYFIIFCTAFIGAFFLIISASYFGISEFDFLFNLEMGKFKDLGHVVR